jgi:hypothetical protein
MTEATERKEFFPGVFGCAAEPYALAGPSFFPHHVRITTCIRPR